MQNVHHTPKLGSAQRLSEQMVFSTVGVRLRFPHQDRPRAKEKTMAHPTITPQPVDALVQALTAHLTTVVEHLIEWMAPTPPALQQLEEQVLRALKDLGGTLLVGLAQHLVPQTPPPTHPCSCGAVAAFQRCRPATCRTVLGALTVTRPYYLCPACHHGVAPFDQQLGWCAGSRSAGLDELLALLGATQDSFAEAAQVLTRLTLVEVAPNTVRAATEQLGAVLAAAEATQVAALQAGDGPAAHLAPDAAGPLCVSLDGVQTHLTPEGWKELCVGAVYQVRPCRPAPQRRADAVQAEAITYVAELGSQREAFGWQLYAEAQRRGATTRELAVVGDGAAWLWTLADLHFPHATQILDWFHATEYVWNAATALWDVGTAERAAWAERQLEALWDGRVVEVVTELARHPAAGEAVSDAHTYFTNQQGRMNYPAYRARGLPVGSGTIESGCKQVVSSRLKGAGMLWRADGARQVAKVRAWLKGGRWAEAMALRGVPQRRARSQPAAAGQTMQRAEATPTVEAVTPARGTGGHAPAPRELTAEVLAVIHDELAQKPAQHPWRRPWRRTQLRQSIETPPGSRVHVPAA
jgi:hypothetical protein